MIECVCATEGKTKRARERKCDREKSINTPLTALNHFLNYTARTQVAICPEPESQIRREISSSSFGVTSSVSTVYCSGVTQVVKLEI